MEEDANVQHLRQRPLGRTRDETATEHSARSDHAGFAIVPWPGTGCGEPARQRSNVAGAVDGFCAGDRRKARRAVLAERGQNGSAQGHPRRAGKTRHRSIHPARRRSAVCRSPLRRGGQRGRRSPGRRAAEGNGIRRTPDQLQRRSEFLLPNPHQPRERRPGLLLLSRILATVARPDVATEAQVGRGEGPGGVDGRDRSAVRHLLQEQDARLRDRIQRPTLRRARTGNSGLAGDSAGARRGTVCRRGPAGHTGES